MSGLQPHRRARWVGLLFHQQRRRLTPQRDLSRLVSNWRSELQLHEFLVRGKTVAIAEIDTLVADQPALRCRELDEDATAPAQDEEFVMMHSDNVEASGFVQHLKLPHYVDFQGELEMIRGMRREIAERENGAKEAAE